MSKTSSDSSELNRISLTCGGDFLEPEASTSKSAKKCIRLELELFETDTTKYPEFNYRELLHLEEKKAKRLLKAKTDLSNDPFADNDDDVVARIAKELEAKYGRGRCKKDDFCTIGMGYDESDSFIDNTEPYDEVIPDEVDTLKGGFYINCGVLEFKNLIKKSYTTRTDRIIKMPERSRKRIISSSSESSSLSSGEYDDDDEEEDDDDDDDEEEEEDDDDEEEQDGSNSESLENEDTGSVTAAKSKKKYKRQKSSALADKPKVTINPSIDRKKVTKKLDATSSSSSSNSPRPSAVENSYTDERQTTTVKDMLKAKRDSFLKSQSGVPPNSTDVESSSENNGTDSATEQGRAENNGIDNLRTGNTILPTSLDTETDALDKLRKAVAESMPKVIANFKIELHQCGVQAAADVNAEHPPKMPRKKFQWTNELQQLLYDVYQARLLGKQQDSSEVSINGYLKKNVVDLWPKGWMHCEELQREIERHKNNSKNVKDKTKTKPEAEPLSVGHLKPIIEDSRSGANSDTKSATSASSNSLKRKLKETPPTEQNAKQPKVIMTSNNGRRRSPRTHLNKRRNHKL